MQCALATPDEAADIHARNFLTDGPGFAGSINGYPINTGTELTLIKADARDYLQPAVGKILGGLAAAGHTPDQIDRIVLTHMHPGHSGGVANQDGSKVFPNTTLHVHEADHAFFLDADVQAASPEVVAVFFDCAAASVAAYKDGISLFAFAALNTTWIADLEGAMPMGHIAVGCALGYLDFRHDAREWRNGNGALVAWYEGFSARPAMMATRPNAA